MRRGVVFFLLITGCLAARGARAHGQGSQDCLDCHADPELTRGGRQGESLFIDAGPFERSVHGGLSCADCHAGVVEIPHEQRLPRASCVDCHDDAVQAYEASIHGRARGAGHMEAPDCTGCHGDLHVLAPIDDPSSPIHPARLPETCGSCHSNPAVVARFAIPVARPIEVYKASIHARAIAQGLDGATCSDCHGSHRILPGFESDSTVARQNVPDTCGRCHEQIAEVYKSSIHFAAFARGVFEAPVCTDCHGEHHILSPREPGSPVSPTNMPLQTCGHCHSDVRLSEKYGLPLDRIPTYRESYHGLAARSGVQTVASCASCHGIHDILPSSDPRSHVYRDNLPETCGRCHPGAGERFAIGPMHATPTQFAHPVTYYIRLVYPPLIFVVIGGMLLHNLLDLLRKAHAGIASVPRASGRQEPPERMSRGFRKAHGFVMLSFPVLVYTGFALKYPESWWARPMNVSGVDFDARSWLHRAAAVVLLVAVAYHLTHLLMDSKARSCISSMRPSRRDFRELKERFHYYIGTCSEPPQGAKVSYVEKVEYLAFCWGTLIMAVTGLVLWFENVTLRWFPFWVVGAATAVHFYEAILASLSIVVWHLYWVIFDPVVYPMDTSWWSGKPPLGRALERNALDTWAVDGEAKIHG